MPFGLLWLSGWSYGIVLFAAGVAAGIVFELAGREMDHGPMLPEAADAPHPHGATGGKRHIVVVAGEKLAGEERGER